MNQVVILGGGRWARVIAGVMCDLLPPETPLAVCSPRGASQLSAWAETNFENRVSVMNYWSEQLVHRDSAVVVVNAARDHAAAAKWALGRGAAVLVEKPLAASLEEGEGLLVTAKQYGGVLAAAHVLRFTRYLANFRDMLPPLQKINSVSLEWVDSGGEERYGEIKEYDSSLPVYKDCLPHVVSISQTVFGVLPELTGQPVVDAGGARVSVQLTLGACPFSVIMQRRGPRRLRRLTVVSARGELALDFSKEPGVIRSEGRDVCADSLWDTAPRPLASLLTAFLSIVKGEESDARLSMDVGLKAIDIGEKLNPAYEESVLPWLSSARVLDATDGDDFYYALTEFVQRKGRLSNKDVSSQIASLRQRLKLSSS